MDKFIVTAWKNQDFTVREAVAYDQQTADNIRDLFKFYGYNTIVTQEDITDVEQMFVTKFEGFAG